MDQDKNREFIMKSESLVKPRDVTAISFLGDFNRILPKKTQQKIMDKGSSTIPYMGFILDPYCFFLAYRIKDSAAAEAMLPDDYELAEVSIFNDEEKQPLVIISAFSARTSAFIGLRLEFYIIARSRKTGLISWIIADYETDTNSHDPKNGFCGYTSDPALLTVSPYGELLVNFQNKKQGGAFSLSAELKNGSLRDLNETLWVEGNLSVDYGGSLKDPASKPFSLIFDPALMSEAVDIPLSGVKVVDNTYLNEIITPTEPVRALVFPYSQHFIIRQDLKTNEVKNRADLENQLKAFLGKKSFKTMSGDDIKKPIKKSILISAAINIGTIIFLLVMLLLRV